MRFNETQVLVPKTIYEKEKQELEKLREEFYASIEGGKVYRTPVLPDNHSYWVYEAFEAMHRLDGTLK